MMTSQLRSRWGGFMVGSKIALDPRESRELQRRTRATTIAVRDRQRAEMILLRAAGMTQAQIAVRLGVSRVTVNDWCQRFLARRLAGLDGAPGFGKSRDPAGDAAVERWRARPGSRRPACAACGSATI